MRETHRILRRAAGVLALAAATTLALTVVPDARAHSVLLGTDPEQDHVLDESPRSVALRFDEPVETALGSIRVYDGDGERVDADAIQRPVPEVVAVAIDRELDDGTYTVAWRVISADSDPISGAFVFHVGEHGAEPGGIADEVAQETPASVSFLYTAVRFVDYALLLLCAGGALALVLVLPMAARSVRRRLYQGLAVVAGALALFALAGLVLQGAQAGGLDLREAVEWSVVSAVAGTRFGEWALARAGLAGALAVLALVLSRRSGGRLAAIACVVLGVALLVTPARSGHAAVAGTLSFAADYAHILAAAAWTGGLAFLLAALLLARSERWVLASRAVPRFSNLAVVAVGLLLVAGTINGYLQVRTWRGIWDTEYGLLLSAKAALVLPLLALGAFNNRYAVPKLKAGAASPAERRRFLRAVGAELSIMVAIVGVTAVLVNAAPAYKEVGMHRGPVSTSLALGPYQLHVTVAPGRPGPNEIELEFGHGEAPDEVVVFATLPSEQIGPLRFAAERVAQGHFAVPDADLSIPGEWELRIEGLKGEFDLYTETMSISIEGES
jgi:copper transport protein